jgi:hypothetical protein
MNSAEFLPGNCLNLAADFVSGCGNFFYTLLSFKLEHKSLCSFGTGLPPKLAPKFYATFSSRLIFEMKLHYTRALSDYLTCNTEDVTAVFMNLQ